ncbi:MAG: thiamine pyrophosphate-binding protein [Proteobacteria bacterium]|nr:thiamine pyrophosphate-binding protein [Pseudomonadota bacterium]
MFVDWPSKVHDALQTAGIRQVGFVPDAGLKELIEHCQRDKAMTDVLLATEEEGIGLAIGCWLGGERPALLMQSSGVGNCINAFAALRTCRVPLLVIVTMRGEWGETNPWQIPMGQTAADHLKLAGIAVHEVLAAESIAPTVAAAAQMAFSSNEGVAVLISQRVIGAKTFEPSSGRSHERVQ